MKLLFFSILGSLIFSSIASADPIITCEVSIRQNQASYWVMMFRGTANNDIATSKNVAISGWTQTKNPKYIPKSGSVSNTDTEEPQLVKTQKPQIFQVHRTAVDHNSVTLDFDLGGSVSVQFLGDSKVKVFYVEPNGPELAKVYDYCEISYPDAGITAGN